MRPPGPILVGLEDPIDVNERLSQYLGDQSSIIGYSHATQDLSMNEDCNRIHFNDFTLIAGNRRFGSSTISTAKGRVVVGCLRVVGQRGPQCSLKLI